MGQPLMYLHIARHNSANKWTVQFLILEIMPYDSMEN